MNWDAVNGIAEIIGVGLVFLSLIYVAIQIRQSTTERRNSSRLATTRLITDWHTVVMSDPELVRIFDSGFIEPTKLDSADRARFIWMLAAWASRMEEMYTQHKSGLIEPELWRQYRAILAGFLKNPILKEWWESKVFVCSEEFYAEVDKDVGDDAVWNADRMRVIVESPQMPAPSPHE